MAKKKKSKAANDLRGYSTTSVAPTPIPLPQSDAVIPVATEEKSVDVDDSKAATTTNTTNEDNKTITKKSTKKNSNNSSLDRATIIASLSKVTSTTKSTTIPQTVVKSATTTSKSTTKLERIKISSEVHQTLLELLRELYEYSQKDRASVNNDDTNQTTHSEVYNYQVLPPLTSLETKLDSNATFDSTKLLRRIASIYDTLIEYGFQYNNIMDCVKALSVQITLPLALDWLCYYIPPTELPSQFIDPTLLSYYESGGNDPAIKNDKETSGLSFIVHAKSKNASSLMIPDTKNLSTLNAIDESTHAIPLTTATTQTFDSVGDICNANADNHNFTNQSMEREKQWLAEYNARLIAQYQYNNDDTTGDYDGDENGDVYNNDHHDELKALDNSDFCFDAPPIMDTHTQPDGLVDDESNQFDNNNSDDAEVNYMTSSSPFIQNEESIEEKTENLEIQSDETRLLELKNTLQAMEEDYNNDANNYMRSKQEIKLLKNEITKLRKQVNGMENKILRRNNKGKTAPVNDSSGRPPPMDDDNVGNNDLVSIFDIDNTPNDNCEPTSQTRTIIQGDQSSVNLPDDAIPSNWTGQTPKGYLEEFCRKEKIARPSFTKLSLNGCQMNLKLSRSHIISLGEKGPVSSYLHTQNYLSMKALYQMMPTIPLYRLFPPFFRSLWISWQSEAKQVTEQEVLRIAEARQEKIEELFLLASNRSLATSNSINRDDVQPLQKNEVEVQHLPAQSQKGAKPENGMMLQEHFHRRTKSMRYQKFLSDRKTLPIFSRREQILDTIKQNSVTILCAETGSGKTTQCCSYILEDALQRGHGDKISILCTQPRRVAAMSVAERVAEEWDEPTVGKLIGYQIRMEAKRTSQTRILFCTTGVVLRRLIEDKELKGISHVVVDEVHERQWQIDVLLVTLRALVNGSRPDLKVILMSATLDKKLFGTFFVGAPLLSVPGRTFPVQTFYLEDLLEYTNHIVEEGSRCARRHYYVDSSNSVKMTRGNRTETIEYSKGDELSDNFLGYSLETRKSMDRVDETVLNYELIEDILEEMFIKGTTLPGLTSLNDSPGTKNGSVLIFLPGIGEIRTLSERLSGSKKFGDKRVFDIIPLHSSLSSMEQKRAFIPSTTKCRKVILSTNIAETSVTIPDVVYVIDTGRFREITRDRRYDSRKLVVSWCSKASVKQRSGRAGRVQAGVCLKLYSSLTEKQTMKSTTDPELQRIPLEEVCLTILASEFGQSCADFLAQTPQPPSEDAVRSALKSLEDIGAIQLITLSDMEASTNEAHKELLTGLGRMLAKLPVDARVGKMLLLGTIFQCTDSILTIAASLSASKSIFATTFDDGKDFKPVHTQFFKPYSDFLTFVNVWNEYKQAEKSGYGKTFCREKFLNYSTIIEIHESRRHYLDLLSGLGFIDLSTWEHDHNKRTESKYNLYCDSEQLVHAVVCAGLFPNVALYTKQTAKGQSLVLHKSDQLFIQSSVNTKLTDPAPSGWMTFAEKFGTESRVSITRTAFIPPITLILFGSNLQVMHAERMIRINEWIEFSSAASTAVILREIQDRLHYFSSSLFEEPTGLERKVDVVISLVAKLLSFY